MKFKFSNPKVHYLKACAGQRQMVKCRIKCENRSNERETF